MGEKLKTYRVEYRNGAGGRWYFIANLEARNEAEARKQEVFVPAVNGVEVRYVEQ